MSLRDQGFRLMGNKELNKVDWTHPAEAVRLGAGWVDCTDMTDAEFETYIIGEQPA
jgi:hypothetical protein